MGDTLRVCYSTSKNCFCQVRSRVLSDQLRRRQDSLICLKLTTGKGSYYLTATDVISDSKCQIHIAGLYADKLGLSEGDQVQVELIDSPQSGTRVAIDPISVDDWEILELNAASIQSDLLNQVRLVWTDLVLPIWVTGQICIFTKIVRAEPGGDDCLLLNQSTELIVSPKDRKRFETKQLTNQIGQNSTKTTRSPNSATGANQGVFVKPTAANPDRPNDLKQKPDRAVGTGASTNVRRRSFQSSLSLPADISNSSTEKGGGGFFTKIKNMWPFHTADSSPVVTPTVVSDSVFSTNTEWSKVEITPIVARVTSCQLHQLGSWWSKYPSICVVSRSLVGETTNDHFLAELSHLLSPIDIESAAKQSAKFRRKNDRPTPPTKTENFIGTVCVVVLDDEDRVCPIPQGHIVLDEMFCKLHRIQLFSRVRLHEATSQPARLETIQIQPTHSIPDFMNKAAILTAFKNYVRVMTEERGYSLILHSSNALNIEISADCSADFLVLAGKASNSQSPESPASAKEKDVPAEPVSNYFLLDMNTMPDLSLSCEEIITNRCNFSVIPEGMVSPEAPAFSPVGCSELYKRLLEFVRASLHTRAEGALLVTGSRGTGKTTLVNSVLQYMVKECHCFTSTLDCTQLRGKRPDAIRRLLDSTIQECIWRQPSLLLIDDLDVLCKAAAGPEEEASPEIIYSAKISEVLKDRLDFLWRRREKVAVIAVSRSRASLHAKLTSTHGTHVFHITEELPSLSQSSRCEMLKSIMTSLDIKDTPSLDQLSVHSAKLEGYVARDLMAVVKRALHAHTVFTGASSSSSLSIEDLDAALEGFTPASLRGVALHSPGENTWKDVGGLHDIKAQLVRMLEWPAKYRKLYAQCPIRLQSGVLLYGAPGTGKTLVAAVVAKEMGLNFISIKGPELLNKYIGASEQRVRDTFKKAQDVSPCILFFDEFESLAPRRGHDSTGVTDRVVNQLLTQLDGVEALEGVYVLAATSRPDLIDPALLRPGRLDKSLCCGIPTAEDRLEILHALGRHMNIDEGVDLAEVAECCEDCTGADLKSLLVNAQLEAVHGHLNGSTLYRDSGIISDMVETEEPVTGIYKASIDEEAQPITPQSPCYQEVRRLYSQNSRNTLNRQAAPSNDVQVVICQSHIDSALAGLQPSVSSDERAKYRQIYEQFTSGKSSAPNDPPDQLVAALQRVSLA